MVKKMLMLAGLTCAAMASTPLYSSDSQKTTVTGSCNSGSLEDQSERVEQVRAIKAAINVNLADPQRWKGKQCGMKLSFAPNGMLIKVSTNGGDKAYCEALVSAAAKTKFPAFTNLDLFRDCKNTWLDMRG